MTDFFSDFADSSPVSREIKRGKATKTVHFRRVTAGERLKLVSGQRMTFGDGKKGSMEMDLGDVSRNRHMLVQFSCVTEDGKPLFKSLDEVQAQPDWLVVKLSEFADEVNRDEDDAPKS